MANQGCKTTIGVPGLIRPAWAIAHDYYDKATGVPWDDATCDLWELHHRDWVRGLSDYHRASQSLPALERFMGITVRPPHLAGGVTYDAQTIKEMVLLSTVIGAVTELKRIGQGKYQASCPFHTDKTPSLNVNDDKKVWYCFSESSGGDIYTFIQRYYDLDFRSALTYAQQYVVSN